jgi:hypothetical protein
MRLDFVGFSADQPIGIVNTGLCRKVIHLVIEKKTGPLHYDAGAIAEVYKDKGRVCLDPTIIDYSWNEV